MTASSPAPPHIASFSKFVERLPNDHLKASVAFGLFMQAEQFWVNKQETEPNVRICCKYHEDYLTDYNIQQFIDKATESLNAFSNAIIGQKRSEFLQAALAEQKKFSWKAVGEGVVAAGAYSVLLILFSVIALRVGIDIVEVYKSMAGVRDEQHQASPAAPSVQAPLVGAAGKDSDVVNQNGVKTK
jgi:hypothetical protein